MINPLQLDIPSVRKELSVDVDGKGYISRQGLSRLIGIRRQSWGRGCSIFNEKIDEMLAQNGLEGCSIINDNNMITDVAAAIVIEYYALDAKPTVDNAKKIYRALSAVGLRSLIQQALNWEPNRKRLTREEIIEMCVLPVASEWQRRFPIEYYEELTRVTKLVPYGHKRPPYWAALTKEFIYDFLPAGIYEKIRKCREETGNLSDDKLHQYLSEDGLVLLEQQQRLVLTTLTMSTTIDECRELLNRASKRTYQLQLNFMQKKLS